MGVHSPRIQLKLVALFDKQGLSYVNFWHKCFLVLGLLDLILAVVSGQNLPFRCTQWHYENFVKTSALRPDHAAFTIQKG